MYRKRYYEIGTFIMTQNGQHQQYYTYNYHLRSIFTEKKVGGVIDGAVSGLYFSLGIASYDITNNEWGYLCKKGNKWYENLGYIMGGLANMQDAFAGLHPGSVDLNTENDPAHPTTPYSNKKDLIGHSQISKTTIDPSTGQPQTDILIDFGPANGAGIDFKLYPGTNSYENGIIVQNHTQNRWLDNLSIDGVNVDRISSYGRKISNSRYNLLYNSCVSQTSRALNMSGAFNIGIHPYFLHAQMYLRGIGFRPNLFSYYLSK